MHFACLAVLLPTLAGPAIADAGDTAFEQAFATFESVYPRMAASEFGVDTAAYRDALTLGRFTSSFWGRELSLDVVRGSGDGACARYAAHVDLPPQKGAVRLVLCPQFLNGGTSGLRQLTVLHELVHAVAGPDECRAMAFAARIEHLATGAYTPVDQYWQANACPGSGFTLP